MIKLLRDFIKKCRTFTSDYPDPYRGEWEGSSENLSTSKRTKGPNNFDLKFTLNRQDRDKSFTGYGTITPNKDCDDEINSQVLLKLIPHNDGTLVIYTPNFLNFFNNGFIGACLVTKEEGKKGLVGQGVGYIVGLSNSGIVHSDINIEKKSNTGIVPSKINIGKK